MKYDGSTVFKVNGVFVAGMATHASAEPGSLVVCMDLDERTWLIEDAPDTYYVTEYYEKYPVVLARLSSLTAAALDDLLAGSRTLALQKVGTRRAHHHPRTPAR